MTDEQARALAIAIMERPEGYDPALLIGFEREWYGANLPLILAALREAKVEAVRDLIDSIKFSWCDGYDPDETAERIVEWCLAEQRKLREDKP